jgi:hypothetical protein
MRRTKRKSDMEPWRPQAVNNEIAAEADECYSCSALANLGVYQACIKSRKKAFHLSRQLDGLDHYDQLDRYWDAERPRR